MKRRFGPKQTCPCHRGKRKFTPLLDEHGAPTDAGKCWSPACGQRFIPGTRTVDRRSDVAPIYASTRGHVYTSIDGTPTLRITIATDQTGEKRAFAEHWNGSHWVKGAGEVERHPYRLTELVHQINRGGIVVIVEGERDADSAHSIGLVATCNPFGAGKWLDTMSEALAGARAVIIPDLDEPGWNHARKVEQSLLKTGVAAFGILDLRTLMPELPEKGDLTEYLQRGGDPELLKRAIDRACRDVDANSSTTHLPEIPDIDWRRLPKPLTDLVSHVEGDRQRIALLVASMTMIGGVIPGVQTLYHGTRYSPGLYLFVVGPPGSGKGSIGPAELIVRKVDEEIQLESAQAFKAYKDELARWKSKGLKAGIPPPEEPERKVLLLPADSTGPVLVQAVCTNPSVVIFDSEADSLQIALRAETGDASAALRKAWQCERVSQARKGNNLLVSTDRPHLSIVFSGTPDQIVALVKHVGSGLTSRIGFIEFEAQSEFRDPFKSGLDHVAAAAKLMQWSIRNLWRFVREHGKEIEFTVVLTESQQQQLIEHFTERLTDPIEDADHGTTLRAGITAVRITTILTVVRRWFTSNHLDPVMEATDDDALLGIVLAEFLRRGTDSIIHRLRATGPSAPLPPAKRKTQEWYASLPNELSAQDALAAAARFGIGRSSIYKLLGREDYFEKIGHGQYRKRHRSQSRGP